MTVDLTAAEFHDDAKAREWLERHAGRLALTALIAVRSMCFGWWASLTA